MLSAGSLEYWATIRLTGPFPRWAPRTREGPLEDVGGLRPAAVRRRRSSGGRDPAGESHQDRPVGDRLQVVELGPPLGRSLADLKHRGLRPPLAGVLAEDLLQVSGGQRSQGRRGRGRQGELRRRSLQERQGHRHHGDIGSHSAAAGQVHLHAAGCFTGRDQHLRRGDAELHVQVPRKAALGT